MLQRRSVLSTQRSSSHLNERHTVIESYVNTHTYTTHRHTHWTIATDIQTHNGHTHSHCLRYNAYRAVRFVLGAASYKNINSAVFPGK